MGRRGHIASRGENQCGLRTSRREGSLLKTQMAPSKGRAVLLLQHQLGECTASLPTTGDTALLCPGPAEGSAGCIQWGPLGNSFSGETLGRDSDGD